MLLSTEQRSCKDAVAIAIASYAAWEYIATIELYDFISWQSIKNCMMSY